MQQPTSAAHPIRVADLVLDEASCRVWRAGRQIALSELEFDLLRFLARNAGCVVSRRDIARNVWRREFAIDTGLVSTHVCGLRRKLAVAGPQLIHTKRGGGYVLHARAPSG